MAAVRDILARLRGAAPGTPPGPAAAGDGGLFAPDPGTPVVLVTAFGIAASALEAALDRDLAALPANARIVCLTDQPDFAPLRRRGIAFEYLPPAALRSPALADARTWRAYLAERYDILIAKWRPERVVVGGASVEDFLA